MKKQINALNYLLITTLTSIVLIGVAYALPQKANAQELRSCVTWEEVKSEVESLYYDHPLPELPDEFKNGCVFGDNGSYIIAISVFKEGIRPPISQVNDTLFSTSIPKFSSIDLGYAIDENWDSIRFYNVCGSVGTSYTSFCQNMPTDEVYIKEGLVCHNYLCIEADNELQSELVRLWNEALEQRQIGASAVSARICTRDPGSNVTLRTRPGIAHPRGLVQVGSGGARVDNYFQQRNYTFEKGEEVSVFSKTHGTDGRVRYEIGTNQWVAWVRSDFVCQNPSEF